MDNLSATPEKRVSVVKAPERVFLVLLKTKLRTVGMESYATNNVAYTKIQPREHSMGSSKGSGVDGFQYEFRCERQWRAQRGLPRQERFQAQPEPQLVRQRLEWQLPVPGGSQLFTFLPGSSFGSFVCQLALPAAEHPAYLEEAFRYDGVFVRINGLRIPR